MISNPDIEMKDESNDHVSLDYLLSSNEKNTIYKINNQGQ